MDKAFWLYGDSLCSGGDGGLCGDGGFLGDGGCLGDDGRPFLPWKVNANLMAPKWICVYPCTKQWRGRSDGSDKETKCSTWDTGNWCNAPLRKEDVMS
nr:hypothetical protein [Tanacetum cinerariifolium]